MERHSRRVIVGLVLMLAACLIAAPLYACGGAGGGESAKTGEEQPAS